MRRSSTAIRRSASSMVSARVLRVACSRRRVHGAPSGAGGEPGWWRSPQRVAPRPHQNPQVPKADQARPCPLGSRRRPENMWNAVIVCPPQSLTVARFANQKQKFLRSTQAPQGSLSVRLDRDARPGPGQASLDPSSGVKLSATGRVAAQALQRRTPLPAMVSGRGVLGGVILDAGTGFEPVTFRL